MRTLIVPRASIPGLGNEKDVAVDESRNSDVFFILDDPEDDELRGLDGRGLPDR